MQTLHFNLQGISIEGTIIDVETVSLTPKPNGMFTLGTLSGSAIRIIQAENEADCEALAAEVQRLWQTLPRPIYAYNRKFVSGWLSDALGAEANIDHDSMDAWKAVADQQALKWPRLRELIRPPVFYYRWGIADYDRERDLGTMRRAMRRAKSANEVISREALGGAPTSGGSSTSKCSTTLKSAVSSPTRRLTPPNNRSISTVSPTATGQPTDLPPSSATT